MNLCHSIDRFFHSRTKDAFALAGWMRMAYAFLVLFDRLILTMDFHFFFLSSAMPLSVSSREMQGPNLLWLAPEHAGLYWTVHGLSIMSAVLLLVGIAPRVQLVALLVTMSAFWTHNSRIWDAQDNMFRFWGIFLLFLPIRSITVWDGLGQKAKHGDDSSTWPMWPFRIWQFQLMAIYTGAGLAKLAVPEWQNGTAMLHVVQTTDFYGGIFNPDFIFNRMGPLMLMTYTSLVIECACLVTAWVWPVCTVVAMFGLHLGIELAMNMHCLEWLCMLGWLVFLVRPQKEDDLNEEDREALAPIVIDEPANEKDVSMETVDVASPPDDETSAEVSDASAEVNDTTNARDEPTTSKVKSSAFPRSASSSKRLHHLGTFILIAIGLAIFVETAPLERFFGLLPETAHPYLQRAVDTQNYFATTFTHPITGPLRLRQAGWYMYSVPPMVSYRYEIVLMHSDGNYSSWESPKWDDMTWYQKKRWHRAMSFYDRLGSASIPELHAFTRYIGRQFKDVASLELYQYKHLPVTWPVNMDFGFFKEARQPLALFQTVLLFSLNLCADFDERCFAWESEGYCSWPISTDMSLCRYSCDYCHQDIASLEEGSRVAIFYPIDYQYFRATVRQIKYRARPQVLLEYDVYNTDEDRYEWFDQHLLWERGLMILREEASDDFVNAQIEETRHEEL